MGLKLKRKKEEWGEKRESKVVRGEEEEEQRHSNGGLKSRIARILCGKWSVEQDETRRRYDLWKCHV